MSLANSPADSGANPPRKRDPDARLPVMIRVPPDLLVRIDRAARRLGLSRAAYILSSTVKELERPES